MIVLMFLLLFSRSPSFSTLLLLLTLNSADSLETKNNVSMSFSKQKTATKMRSTRPKVHAELSPKHTKMDYES